MESEGSLSEADGRKGKRIPAAGGRGEGRKPEDEEINK